MSTLPGQSVGELVDPLHLVCIIGIHHHQTVEVTITYVTCNGT